MTPLPPKPPESPYVKGGFTTRDDMWQERELAIADRLEEIYNTFYVDDKQRKILQLIAELRGTQ